MGTLSQYAKCLPAACRRGVRKTVTTVTYSYTTPRRIHPHHERWGRRRRKTGGTTNNNQQPTNDAVQPTRTGNHVIFPEAFCTVLTKARGTPRLTFAQAKRIGRQSQRYAGNRRLINTGASDYQSLPALVCLTKKNQTQECPGLNPIPFAKGKDCKTKKGYRHAHDVQDSRVKTRNASVCLFCRRAKSYSNPPVSVEKNATPSFERSGQQQ